jgi:hypothetical protein
MYGEPITVNGMSEDVLEAKRGELQAALNRLMAEADGYFTKRSA